MTLSWFKIPIAEFLKETRRMSLEAKGAYIAVLCDYYENGPMPGPALINIIGLPAIEAEVVWLEIEHLFTYGSDKLWHHARADQDIADRAKLKTRSVTNGQRGGRPARPFAESVPQTLVIDEAAVKAMRAEGHLKAGTPLAEFEIDEDSDEEPIGKPIDKGIPVETVVHQIGAAPPIAVPQPTEPVDDVDDDGDDLEDESQDARFKPMPKSFALDGEEIHRCRNAGATAAEIAEWFDDWKNGHLARGTLAANWLAAWQTRFANKMDQRPTRAKPRVEVSRKA
jgi:uncharacterized protein YdaU (DUF1376 family)